MRESHRFPILLVLVLPYLVPIASPVEAASAVVQRGGHFGGGGLDEAFASAFDSQGNFAVVGSTSSGDFPASAEAFQPAPGGGLDAYVASFDPEGNLRFATYLGGSAEERGLALAIDAADNILVAGLTTSNDLPVSNDSTYSGGHGDRATADGYVAKLSADGSQLLFATYLGGVSFDVANSLALEADGKLLVSGITQSANFPVTVGALQTRYGGGANDRFVARLDLAVEGGLDAQLAYSTFLGGTGVEGSSTPMPNDSYDYALGLGALLLDSEGHVLVGLSTSSSNFPVPAGAGPVRLNGGQDAVLVKLDLDPGLPPGDQVLAITTFGGPFQDSLFGACLSPTGSVWLVGHTWSLTFPVTADAYQQTPAGADWADAFLVELAVDSGELLYSTLLGGSHFDNFFAVSADLAGGVAAVGRTLSTDLRITENAQCRSFTGIEDALIAYLAPDRRMLFASYAGGAGEDEILGLARSPAGELQGVGWTGSHSLKWTESLGLGSYDAMLLGFELRFPAAMFTAVPERGSAPLPVHFDAGASTTPPETSLTKGVAAFAWDFGGGATDQGQRVEHTFVEPGRHVVTLTLTNSAGLEAVARRSIEVGCPSGPLGDWSAADVGDPAFPGGARLDGEAVTLCAGGSRLAGAADRFRFIHRQLECDDFTFTVQVQSAASDRSLAQVGIMVRESLEPNARHAALVLRRLSQGTDARLHSRSELSGGTANPSARVPLAPPAAWLRLERRGDVLTAAVSADGATWDESTFPAVTIEGLSPSVHVGFAGMGDEPGDAASSFRPVQGTFAAIEIEERGATGVPFRRADCNGDGKVDISDPVATLGSLFLGEGAPGCDDACDANDDGAVDISDAVNVLNVLFLGTSEIPPPNACGENGVFAEEDADCPGFAGC